MKKKGWKVMKKNIISFIFFTVIIFAISIISMPIFASGSGKQRSSGEKAMQGASNILFGWTEVVASPIRGVQKHGSLGVISGIFDSMGSG